MPVSYTLLTLPLAQRQLRRLRKTHSPKTASIIASVLSLAKDPRPSGSQKLTNRSELRLRVGDYRILYSVDDVHRTVTISAIAHRREVYR
jgi:mRNA interferase RelE/StbE